MLIERLKVSGLLSFGPTGIDLPMEGLNVLIGPNGSGKSNFLEVLALLKAAPVYLPRPVMEAGGIGEWLWKGATTHRSARIEAVLKYPHGSTSLTHVLEFIENGQRFEVTEERVVNIQTEQAMEDADVHYRFEKGHAVLREGGGENRDLPREYISPDHSILSQVRDPQRYPALEWLNEQYGNISVYRNWCFGPKAALRRDLSASARSDWLVDGGENLAGVVLELFRHRKPDFMDGVKLLYQGIEDITFGMGGGNVRMFVTESGGREIPATMLSDGTLRYLSLLAILLHPAPPSLIAIDEPELGLHPDIVPHIAELLVQASARTQLVVTTHSRMLVDALTDHPSSIIACSQENGESRFERLDTNSLKPWLDKYSLGQLWSMGEIGANRW